MGSGPDEFELVTQSPPASARAAFTVRQSPRVSWTDREGTHEQTIDGPTLVGTATTTQLTLADPLVSRLHAELRPRPEGLLVRDLGSRNGTFVAGVRVVEAFVPPHAPVQMGGTTLTLIEETAAAAVDLWPRDEFFGLIGRSVAMRALFAQLARVAAADATVLIQGETGTGKELVSRALHEASARARAPFAIVDCGALPPNLLEAELFGHARGAFTGAVGARAGVFEAAQGGTVFLDEIGELPLALQPKLLRVLEARSVRRLGETAYRAVDVRIVAATHRDLPKLVNAGAFREDLYFRLAVVPLALPPLREHPEDVPALIEAFAAGRASPEVVAELSRTSAGRPWLGNVRELRNFVERALLLGTPTALALATSGGAGSAPGAAALPLPPADVPFKDLRDLWLGHLEREYLRQLLERHQGDTARVADASGLDRSYVYRLMKKHCL